MIGLELVSPNRWKVSAGDSALGWIAKTADGQYTYSILTDAGTVFGPLPALSQAVAMIVAAHTTIAIKRMEQEHS